MSGPRYEPEGCGRRYRHVRIDTNMNQRRPRIPVALQAPRAAMIYPHATAEADQVIADALDKRIEGAKKPAEQGRDDHDDGTAGVVARRG